MLLAFASGGCFAAAQKIEFNRDVRPILAAKCYACHGPDGDKRKADLRLDVRAEAVKDVIKPGQPDQSELWKRLISTDSEEVMPPPSSPKQLTEAERNVLRRWIAEGAEYQEHWSFAPIKRPALPAGAARNPVDAFIRHELAGHHLDLSPPADRLTLLRRVSLDLTGLPPSPEEVASFMDASLPSEPAYERLVDRLLASPHFGERWGRHWLDMARYADSNGFLGDAVRPNAWRYRDWVINAINRDLPFDQFTVEQIAGDLLPDPTRDQLTATGFHRNAALNTEAGVDKEEARFQNLADRVNTTGRVWMGLTVGCAQCHTHKYDPITIRDYYSFYAFFNNTQDTDEPKSKAPVLAEVTKDRRQTYVHMAGDYARRGPDVVPASLTALPPMEKTAQNEASRLDLAHWLVSPRHPLTSRVAVNHIWSKLFGIGLVSTPDDFGATGEPPSHPELLDWLAAEFMESGWSMKHLHRLVVTSAAYRRASTPTAANLTHDPDNISLWRFAPRRLEAEVVRDALWFVGAGLDGTLGGPDLPHEQGLAMPRRSLYFQHAQEKQMEFLQIFDVASVTECYARKQAILPQQALALGNNEWVLAQARQVAQQVIGADSVFVRSGFERILGRAPTSEESAACLEFLRERGGTPRAREMLALVLLNHHEFVTLH